MKLHTHGGNGWNGGGGGVNIYDLKQIKDDQIGVIRGGDGHITKDNGGNGQCIALSTNRALINTDVLHGVGDNNIKTPVASQIIKAKSLSDVTTFLLVGGSGGGRHGGVGGGLWDESKECWCDTALDADFNMKGLNGNFGGGGGGGAVIYHSIIQSATKVNSGGDGGYGVIKIT
jgi:hypothetical protein